LINRNYYCFYLTAFCARDRGGRLIAYKAGLRLRDWRVLAPLEHFVSRIALPLNVKLGRSSELEIARGIRTERKLGDLMQELELAKRLSDDELVLRLRRCVREDRELSARLLIHFGEVDARGLYRDQGFGSMFDYAVSALHMSESEAALRIRTARVAREFPAALEMVARGELNLTSLKLLAPVLTHDNVALLEMARFKSKLALQELIAKHFPSPDVPDSIRRLPARSPECTSLQPAAAPGTLDFGAEHSRGAAAEVASQGGQGQGHVQGSRSEKDRSLPCSSEPAPTLDPNSPALKELRSQPPHTDSPSKYSSAGVSTRGPAQSSTGVPFERRSLQDRVHGKSGATGKIEASAGFDASSGAER
jgi:hypothetical protein